MSESAPIGKICIAANELTHLFRNGGIGTHNWLLADAMATAGWNVHILYCADVESPEQLARCRRLLNKKGITLWHLPEFESPAADKFPCGLAGELDTHSMRVRRALEQLDATHHFDLIEFGEWSGYAFRTVQARRMGLSFRDARIVVKLHSSNQWCREANRNWLQGADELILDYYEKYSFENADVQLSPSRYMLSYAASVGWRVKDDARTLPYCFPHTAEIVGHRHGYARELVFFGRLEHRKGLKLFLDAAKAMPAEISFAFLGREVPIDGVAPTELIHAALAGRKYEIHTGFDGEQALDYLSEPHRIAIIPSLAENFPFTVLECAAKGIPFLAASVGGIPEIVSDPQMCEKLLFEPNPRSLQQQIEAYIATDAGTRHQYVQRMLDVCNSKRNHAAVCQAYAEFLPRRQSPYGSGSSAPALAAGDRGNVRVDSPVRGSGGRPLVSLVVPFYNLGDYLPDALASLEGQDYPNTEVIVVNDGSTDPSSLAVLDEMQQKYPHFRYIRQHNQGLGAARNAGLAVARGEFFLPLDADNIARPEMVSRFVHALEKNPNLTAATCLHLAFEETEHIAEGKFSYAYRPCGGPLVAAALRNVYGDANGMFRAAALRELGGYSTDRDIGYEDWEMYVKLVRTGHQIDVIPDYLFYYRHRETSMLRTTDMVLNRRRVLRQFFAADGMPRSEQIQLWTALVSFDERCWQQAAQIAAHQPYAAARPKKKKRPLPVRVFREVRRVVRRTPYYDVLAGKIQQLTNRAA